MIDRDISSLMDLDLGFATELVSRRLRALPGDITKPIDGEEVAAIRHNAAAIKMSALLQGNPEASNVLLDHIVSEAERIWSMPGGIKLGQAIFQIAGDLSNN